MYRYYTTCAGLPIIRKYTVYNQSSAYETVDHMELWLTCPHVLYHMIPRDVYGAV